MGEAIARVTSRHLWLISVVVGAGLGAFSLLADGIIGVGGVVRGYVFGEANLVWRSVALVAGPVMGWSGAAIASEPERPPIVAVAAPATMLVAEAFFLAIDRSVWSANLGAEPYRLIDLGVIAALFVGGLALPAFFENARRRRRLVYLVVALAGVGGAFGLVVPRSLIAGIA